MLAKAASARDGLTDAELLRRFRDDRDEAAFGTLVARHGPMVFGVCRRVLGDYHGAEDAFQATFLVLARRAGAADRDGLGPWLYGIASRTARKARVAAARRREYERRAAALCPAHATPAEPAADLGPLLDEELRRLPAGLRAAVLLCDVGGFSRRQAARHLGCPESTLSGRLAVARRRLAVRLARRGVAPSLAGLAAPLPPLLANQTARAALQEAARPAAGASAAASLSDEVIRTMSRTRYQLAAALTIVAALAGSTLVAVSAGDTRPTPAAGGAGGKPAAGRSLDRFRFLAFDGFDGQFGLNWQPVRHDPSHASLAKNPGRLTITTQRGSIHGPTDDPKARANEPLTKNLFLIDNPLARDADFTATTCVVGFRPAKQYQQAGLILYNDDDNYLKWNYEFNDDFLTPAPEADREESQLLMRGVRELRTQVDKNQLERWMLQQPEVALPVWASRQEGGRPFFIGVAETGGNPEHHITAPAAPNLPRVWLRITKRGNLYDCSTSTDGERFVKRGTIDWGKGGPKKLGLLAQNGGVPGVPGIDAEFEFFELRAP
jgi:RNA polymerase sigma factor (sigma-70 family)